MHLEYLLAWIANETWAIEQSKALEILGFLEHRAEHCGRDSAQKLNPSRERSVRSRDGLVAVIAMHGMMAQRVMPGASIGGGVSTEAVGRAVDKAVSDPGVKTIILDIDSPGGSVVGTRELAAKIRDARTVKPVIAQVDSTAASAAYWVAAQATEIVSTPGGAVGSIGVIAVHEDICGRLEQRGIKPTIISAGKYKGEGNPFAPLTDDAREYFQARVDEGYADFVSDVAIGRGIPTNAVTAGYGEGRMLGAQKAIAAGMIDRIATFDQTLARFVAPPSPTHRRARAARAIARTS